MQSTSLSFTALSVELQFHVLSFLDYESLNTIRQASSQCDKTAKDYLQSFVNTYFLESFCKPTKQEISDHLKLMKLFKLTIDDEKNRSKEERDRKFRICKAFKKAFSSQELFYLCRTFLRKGGDEFYKKTHEEILQELNTKPNKDIDLSAYLTKIPEIPRPVFQKDGFDLRLLQTIKEAALELVPKS